MQEWFQWGYDGCDAADLQRLVNQTNNDGRESDDDGNLMGESDGAARYMSCDAPVRVYVRRRRTTEQLSRRRKTQPRALYDYDDDADSSEYTLLSDAESYLQGDADTGIHRERPPMLVRRAAVVAMPATLVSPVLVTLTIPPGGAFGTESREVVVAHGGCAATESSTVSNFEGPGATFRRESLVTSGATYIGYASGADDVNRPLTFHSSEVVGPRLYGHTAAALPQHLWPGRFLVCGGSSAPTIGGLRSSRHQPSPVTYLVSLDSLQPCWKPLSAVGVPFQPRVFSTLCCMKRPFQHWSSAAVSATARDSGSAPEVSQVSNEVDTGQAADANIEGTSFLQFGGCDAQGNATADSLWLTVFPIESVVTITATQSGIRGVQPPARYGHSATMLPSHNPHSPVVETRMVIFGGVGQGEAYLHDCHVLTVSREGLRWREVTVPNEVPRRAFHSAVWCSAVRAVLFVGGEVLSRPVTSTWALRFSTDIDNCFGDDRNWMAFDVRCPDLHSDKNSECSFAAAATVVERSLGVESRKLHDFSMLIVGGLASHRQPCESHAPAMIATLGTSLQWHAFISLFSTPVNGR
jgi:hypothetical protein